MEQRAEALRAADVATTRQGKEALEAYKAYVQDQTSNPWTKGHEEHVFTMPTQLTKPWSADHVATAAEEGYAKEAESHFVRQGLGGAWDVPIARSIR